MNRRILISFITSAAQTMVYYIVFYIGGTIAKMIHEPKRMTISEAVGFGAFLNFSIMAFGIIMITINLIDALANQRRWTWGLLISITAFYLIYWGQGIRYIPFKTGLFLMTGLISIYSKIPIEKLLNNLIGVKTSKNVTHEI